MGKEVPVTRSIGIELPGLARMAQVARAISEEAARGPAPAPDPLRILTPWVAMAPPGGEMMSLSNRAVMAPIPTGTATIDGHPNVDTNAWYVARARGGVGLIVVEATFVELPRLPDPLRPLILVTGQGHDAFCRLADEVRAAGSDVAISLDHPDQRSLERWSAQELRSAVDAFEVAARRAKRAGFSAFHLSLDQTAWLGRALFRSTNRRTDRYGRGPNGRMQIVREVVGAVAAVGCPLIVRVPCPAAVVGSAPVNGAAALAKAMVVAGATVIEVSPGPRFDDRALPLLAGNGEAVLSTQTGQIATHLLELGHAVPVIASGRIASAAGAEAALSVPGVEAVSIGRALVADPAWVAKVSRGIDNEIVPCIGCLACLNRSEAPRIGCVTNGDAGHESESFTMASSARRVAVLGSGLPALEFARVAASRGHLVTVVPDSNPLGGITGLRSGVPGNAEYGRAPLAAFDRLRHLGVVVKSQAPLDAEVTVDGRPAEPLPVRWGTGRNVLRAADVLGRDLHQMYGIGRRVAVCGPGALAAEVALFLAGWGRRPTVIVPGDHGDPFPDVHPQHGARLRERLLGYRCELVTGTKPVAWHDARDRKSKLTVKRGDEVITLGPFQTAVDCSGWPLPSNAADKVLMVGDSASANDLRQLVRAANINARTI